MFWATNHRQTALCTSEPVTPGREAPRSLNTSWPPKHQTSLPWTPLVVAQQAINKMKLAGPDIASPQRTAGTYIVGMPMWLWVNTSPTTFGPNTTSAPAPAARP